MFRGTVLCRWFDISCFFVDILSPAIRLVTFAWLCFFFLQHIDPLHQIENNKKRRCVRHSPILVPRLEKFVFPTQRRECALRLFAPERNAVHTVIQVK